MTELIKNYLEKIQIGKGQSFKNLSLYPLLSDEVIPFDVFRNESCFIRWVQCFDDADR